MIWSALVLCFAAQQEPKQPQAPPQAPPQQWKTTLTTTDSHRFESDLEDNGDVSVTHLKLSADVMYLASQRDIWTFNGGIDWLHYDFSSNSDLSFGGHSLFEDIYILRLEATYMRVFDPHWTGVGYASAYHSFEEGARIQDSGSYAIGVGALYRVDQDLTLGLLFRLQTRIEDGPYLYPIPYIEWQISPRLQLRTEQKPGYGFALGYALEETKTWTLDGRGYYATRRFRLDSNNFLDEGVVEDDRIALDVGIRYQPTPRANVALYLGFDLWQKFWVEDKRGNDRAEINTDPAPFLALSASYSF